MSKIKKLYKYRGINKNTFESLINNELYFSLPENFNDPFDSKTNIYYSCKTEEEFISYLKTQPYNEYQKQIALQKWKNRELTEKKIVDFCKSYFPPHIKILSLTEKNDDLLMWSHYAENHFGICLEFKIDLIETLYSLKFNYKDFNDSYKKLVGDNFKYSGFLPIEKVVYKNDMPEKIDFINFDEDKLYKFLLTKAKEWEYEKEWRIIVGNDKINKNTIRFDKNYLSKIIFGLRTPKKDIITIKNIINRYYKNVSFYYCFPVDFKYKLDIKKIEDFEKFISKRN